MRVAVVGSVTEQLEPRTQEPQRPAGRHPDDFYATPRWVTVAMLDAIDFPRGFNIVEPSCGDGAILDVLRERYDARALRGIELDVARGQEARRRIGCTITLGDYLAWAPRPGAEPSWIVGNPPFSLAQRFVEHSLSIVDDGCRITFLLRLAFLSSQSRRHLFDDDAGFAQLLVLPRRPSFTPDGGTDRYDYGWFSWVKGSTSSATIEHLEVSR